MLKVDMEIGVGVNWHSKREHSGNLPIMRRGLPYKKQKGEEGQRKGRQTKGNHETNHTLEPVEKRKLIKLQAKEGNEKN